jgi:Protein of unknown function (DUF3631)
LTIQSIADEAPAGEDSQNPCYGSVTAPVTAPVTAVVTDEGVPKPSETLVVTDVTANEGAENPAPICGAELLDEIVARIRRHVVLGPHDAEAIALWVLHAHALNAFETSPRLHLRSPVLGCGKTNLAAVIKQLTGPRSHMPSSCSIAAYFRFITKAPKNEASTVTLILDEIDTFLAEDRKEAIGILNSGHTRAGATVLRCGKDPSEEHEAREFSTWAATVFAGIGKLPATLESRSITIDLRRKKKSEKVARRLPKDSEAMQELAARAEAWVKEHFEALQQADPEIPECLYNRAADNWFPLLAIADEAGGRWPDLAREIASAIDGEGEDPTPTIMLLSDIRTVFQGFDKISTAKLLSELAAMEDRPWGDYNQVRARTEEEKPLQARQLASLVGAFEDADGKKIKPTTIRSKDGKPSYKGYHRAAFEDVFDRYLPALPSSPSVTPVTSNKSAGLRGPLAVTTPVTTPVTEALQAVHRTQVDE